MEEKKEEELREKWRACLTEISQAKDGTAENPATWVVEIAGDFSVEGSLASTITGAHKTVWLVGKGTIFLSDNSGIGNILRVAAGQTFIIYGPTLEGNLANTAPAVYIEGGKVELKSGAICGNLGSGVVVDISGTFEMSGGAISGNGNGVWVNGGGTFEMSGGTISGNRKNGNGGGVYVEDGEAPISGGAFTMTGGTICGNQANSGGGVYLEGGTSEISNGIEGRTSKIKVGTFKMTGGTIYGKYKPAEDGVVLKNTAQNGAALCANGGTITPHTLVTTNDTIKDGVIQGE